MSRYRWLGIVCCCVLFVVVFCSLRWHMQGAFISAGHPELGLLLFLLPGAVASFFSRQERLIEPLIGAMLALPLCILFLHLFFSSDRAFWQEVAWLFSAVFWSVLGSLGYLLVLLLRRRK
ncbi:inner membrane protein YbjM [Entomohabitans teleogrylli]|uniref:inner membrane protein YbjM n=1 Tax=Entomohabitans teleogrylli TaxID=1384589 RepID=UPI00073D2D96|nr:inner membrane protein YbjM [Entomohabitans teleogrylli]